MKNVRLLFILKKRSSYGVSYGLVNSCAFICNALKKTGMECKVVEVVDNNCIDREVHLYKPTHVSVDALWVVPEKFNVLLKKYPNVKWDVRIHSKIPFLANEGIAFEWLYGYEKVSSKFNNFVVAANSKNTALQLHNLGINTVYLPNIYDLGLPYYPTETEKNEDVVNIGCFGSIRPLKNHLNQATAAILFADKIGKKLKFHINSDRIEQKGEPILKNIENLFLNNPTHELVKHPWMNHNKFLKLVNTMDVGMQVSFSESFCIVAADFAFNNKPILGSFDIEWLCSLFKTDPNNCQDIVNKLTYAYNYKRLGLHWLNKYGLWKHNRDGTERWLDYILGEEFIK
jgi:hypothetical protein